MMRTRVAKRASAGWNVAKTMMQTACFWLVFLVLLPALMVGLERLAGVARFAFPAQLACSSTLFVLASLLGLWSGWTMAIVGQGTPLPLDTARQLVVAGPYRFVRNPMAVAGLTQGAAVGLGCGSVVVLVYVLSGFFVWNYGVRPIEEADLARRFGAEFDRYRQSIRCWIPTFPGYPSPRRPRPHP